MHTKDAESVVSNQTELQQVINFSLGVVLSGLGVIALLYLVRREKNSSPG
jgi:hypothetical protein